MSDWSRWPPRGWEAPTPRRQFAIFTAIAGYLTTALVGIGLSATVAGAVANIAIGAALLGLYSLFAPKPPVMTTPQAQSVINQTVGPRLRGYGRALLGGTRAFFDSTNGSLYQIVMMHSGYISAIESIRVGDKTVTLDGNGDVVTDGFNWFINGRFGGETQYAIRIYQYLGTTSQTADPMIAGAFPGVWTSEHRLRGIAYLAARFRSPPQEEFQRIFPDGYNTPLRAVCRLSEVWDPRSNTTGWSDNSGLCILDYLTHPDGFRKSLSDIDIASFIAFANLCDEAVPLKAGGYEPRYRLWGVYQLTDDPEAILTKMKATCDAELYQNAQGKIAIRGGKWEAPTVTITGQDIIAHNLEQGSDKFAAFNELKIMYTSAAHDYQTIEATPWIDLADQDDRGPIPAELDLDFVPSPSQARRLAKIHRAKHNPEWKGSVSTNLSGLRAINERSTRLVIPELEIDSAFYLGGFRIETDLSRIDMEVLTFSEAAYQWNPATEEGDNPAIPEDTAPDLTFPVPQNLTLSAVDGDTIEAAVTPATRDGLELQVQIRRGAGSTWQNMQTQDDNVSAIFEPAAPGQYQATSRWVGPQNVVGEWSFPYATLDTSVPVPPPSELMVDVDGETVSVSWRNPNFAQFYAARVYRVPEGMPFDPGAQINLQYGAPNGVLFYDDTPADGDWSYFVTAEDANGNRSTPAGPVTAEVV
ncbi:hypothetical protein VW35_02235 [Devosia soli]|uniref:Uncharacterized protein n=1 Tax=Devosia soli TaxID=361041 RepID=A0A0F5LF68_9HYPH|nr:phage tail protein [Devosia soli]KKB81011.1 hypothetical protein VW35_02235 [Devosia soli]